MTIEEEFFKVFGIERSLKNWKMRADFLNVSKEAVASAVYPEITAEKLLQLICILNSTNGVNCTAYESKTIDNLKKEILQECMQLSDDLELKQRVKALFEGEE